MIPPGAKRDRLRSWMAHALAAALTILVELTPNEWVTKERRIPPVLGPISSKVKNQDAAHGDL